MSLARVRACALTTAAAILTCAAAAGQEPMSPFTVETRVESGSVRPGGELLAELILGIPPDHTVYADSVEIDIAPGAPGRITDLKKPAALTKREPATDSVTHVYKGRAVFGLRILVPRKAASGEFFTSLRVTYQGCSGSFCFLPETRSVEIRVPLEGPAAAPSPREGEGPEKEKPAGGYGDMGFFLAVLAAFGGGLMLSLSPCIYPLIPVTAAVVSAAGGDRNWKAGLAYTLVYVFGLSATYAVLGALVAGLGGTFGAFSGHWAVVTAIGALFLVLSWNLFGVYELELPEALRSRLAMRRTGGFLGLFSMGAVSGLAVSPCIAAPVAAVLTYISTTGDVLFGAALLFATAWGMSALLILVGTFPGLAQKLPRSGKWMLAVKTGLGVVLVLAALYFLMTVLPAWLFTPWPVLPLIAFGLWRGARKTDLEAARGKRALRAAGLTALVFGAYFGVGALVRGAEVPVLSAVYPREIVRLRSGIDFRADREAALREAKAEGKPVMMFFTGKTCPACRRLERVSSRAGRPPRRRSASSP